MRSIDDETDSSLFTDCFTIRDIYNWRMQLVTQTCSSRTTTRLSTQSTIDAGANEYQVGTKSGGSAGGSKTGFQGCRSNRYQIQPGFSHRRFQRRCFTGPRSDLEACQGGRNE